MAKIVLPSIASGYNPATINNNFQLIATALNNNVLYRANIGSEPNQMTSLLDMNNQRIINLPAPQTDTEPFRKKDANDFITSANGYAAAAAASATSAAASASSAAVSAGQAANSASAVIAQGNQLISNLNAQGQELVDQLTANGQVIVQNAQAAATEAGLSRDDAVDAKEDAEQYATDASVAFAGSQAIRDSLAGGTIGFDAIAYDFGSVADPISYFNRDFGTIV